MGGDSTANSCPGKNGQTPSRRLTGIKRDSARTQEWVPLEGYAQEVRPPLHLLAKVEKMGRAGSVGRNLPGLADHPG
jgi:hypothetical protein